MPGTEWDRRVGTVSKPEKQQGGRSSVRRDTRLEQHRMQQLERQQLTGERPAFTTYGPRADTFSYPEYMPTTPERPAAPAHNAGSPQGPHERPFRPTSPNAQHETTFDPTPRSISPSRSSHRYRQQSDSVVQADLEVARRASRKIAAPPREVASLVRQVESAVSARFDPADQPAGDEIVMRRIPHPALRSRFYDNGRKSTAPARVPITPRVISEF